MSILWSDKKRILGLPISFTKYELDEERLYIKTGFLTRREDEVRLYRIMDVTLIQTLGQRIFGVGSIHCCSSDSSMKEFDIVSVKTPRHVKEILSQHVEEERNEKRVYTRESLDSDSDGCADNREDEF